MSGHKYFQEGKDLFDDEVNDDTFVNSYRSRIPSPQPKPSPSPYIADLEREKQAMLQKQKEIEQRTVESSLRSISLLEDSTKIGVETAIELNRQHDHLLSTSRRLDEINTNLNYSQKHLNGIKSVFYGFKNYLSGKSDQSSSKGQASPSSSSSKPGTTSRLDDTLNTMNSSTTDHFTSHPTTRLRSLDQQQIAPEPISDTQRINKMLDANLDEMVTQISRLKGLGVALGEEIEQQNHLIDEIHDKVDVADIKIGHQNKQMNKLLGK